tara:strand:+ start:84 stop:263 length:180 start_codon:yes stop_codon:yes gene_type:complete
MNEDLLVSISSVFNNTGAYKKLGRILQKQAGLNEGEVEELVDRLESFIVQEIDEIIDER